jgi:PIN domain nuclease of toxin-antitoxin system
MRLLLDTHVFLWCVGGDRQLGKTARAAIANATEVYVSSASIWEAAIKQALGKLDVDISALVLAITASGFIELPITARHAAAVSRLPDVHRDPFDRILIAQALSEPLRFLTADSALKGYSDLVEVVR